MFKHFFTSRSRLHNAVDKLAQHSVPAEVRSRLEAFLYEAPARELYHANPRLLAARLGLEERTSLKVLLAALHEGIVTLHWDIRCVHCGTLDHRHAALAQLHHDFQCTACHLISSPRLDQNIRITFSPQPSLRPLPDSADDPAYRARIDEQCGVVPGQAVLMLPEFQRFFPHDRLLPEESLEIAHAVLLFTDLAGSTALYAARGDPRAYHLVHLHFDVLFAAADRHGGTVVKTIGDAVMAALPTAGQAMQAALAMQRQLHALNARERLEGDERLILKLGLHCGPCLHVTLNERPDYFGTTVNMAARVQSLSHGNDIVFTDRLHDDPDVQSLLGSQPLESQDAQLKGIAEAVRVHRLLTTPVPSTTRGDAGAR